MFTDTEKLRHRFGMVSMSFMLCPELMRGSDPRSDPLFCTLCCLPTQRGSWARGWLPGGDKGKLSLGPYSDHSAEWEGSKRPVSNKPTMETCPKRRYMAQEEERREGRAEYLRQEQEPGMGYL